MWIARDKNGELYLYSSKPILLENGMWSDDNGCAMFYYDSYLIQSVEIDSDNYPEVTFENSPKELVIK